MNDSAALGWEPDSAVAVRRAPSPNHGDRAPGVRPDALVLHYTGMADGPTALAWLRDPASQVSCHYLVEESGGVVQLVPEQRRAWHAGRSSWHGTTDMNSASIGVEIVNGGHDFGLPPFPDRQIEAVIALCRDVAARNGIAPERVLAHSDIAPGRKRDPGERFPWAELHAAGVGHWVSPARATAGAPSAVTALRADLAAYGYDVELFGDPDPAFAAVVAAFQRHFRAARVDGVADAETAAILRALLDAVPTTAAEPVTREMEPGRGRA